jgi:hypothetical protein
LHCSCTAVVIAPGVENVFEHLVSLHAGRLVDHLVDRLVDHLVDRPATVAVAASAVVVASAVAAYEAVG